MTEYVLIVAGGKGLRMGTELPKQFLPIGGKPVLMRTMEAFYAYNQNIRMIVVLPHSQQDRFHSVKNGLEWVNEPALVGVHDGVRPFVSQEVIARCYREAALRKAVIPVIDIVETVRHLVSGSSVTVNRNDYKLVQTPQVFDASLLKEAYRQAYVPEFTDDASVVEAMGQPVALVEGNRENMKITTPFDLKIASALLGE